MGVRFEMGNLGQAAKRNLLTLIRRFCIFGGMLGSPGASLHSTSAGRCMASFDLPETEVGAIAELQQAELPFNHSNISKHLKLWV